MGLSLGSFLNVVIYRLPRDQSLVTPRSRCPSCGHQLAWFENVPVLAWLALGGKCRTCRAPISPRYIAIELLVGLLFLACLARFGWTWELVGALTFVVFLVPLTFIDAEWWVLPFELTLPGIALGVALSIPRGGDAVVSSVLGALVCFLFFRALEWLGWLLLHKEALGAGDKFLLAMAGAFLGLGPIFGVVFVASVQGAVYGGLNLKLRGRAGPDAKPLETSVAPSSAAVDPPSSDVVAASVTSQEPVAPDASSGPAPSPGDAAPGLTPSDVAPASSAPAPDDEPTFTPAFLAPGLSPWRRAVLLPWTLFLQTIPDEPPPDPATGEFPEWVPDQTAVPFGPWIALAALEVMLLGPRVVSMFRGTWLHATARLMFE
ncbi:MAG: prepilin peptidase [Archangium sp.]|nr:prepilin peptidase [Archangium sp.]